MIYGKPSALKYRAANSYELFVESNDIEPFFVRNLKIKAKKKEDYNKWYNLNYSKLTIMKKMYLNKQKAEVEP